MAPALCSGNGPIHTDCASANHSSLTSRGAAFAPYPIVRHFAETSKMAAKDPNQAFEQISQEMEDVSEDRETLRFMHFGTIPLGLTNMLNHCFTSTFLTSCCFPSFSVCSVCVMWFVVSLSHYKQMLIASSIVLMFQNQLRVVKPDVFVTSEIVRQCKV